MTEKSLCFSQIVGNRVLEESVDLWVGPVGKDRLNIVLDGTAKYEPLGCPRFERLHGVNRSSGAHPQISVYTGGHIPGGGNVFKRERAAVAN